MKNQKLKNFILVPLLIINLVVFNFAALPAFAEEGEPGQPCPPEEPPVCEQGGESGDGGGAVIITGDSDVLVETENDINTNVLENETPNENNATDSQANENNQCECAVCPCETEVENNN